MVDLILSLLPGGSLTAILAAIVAALGWGFHQRLAGARRERDKQAGRDRAALEDRLEMDREATAEERRVRDLSEEEARREALKWAKR